MIVSIGLADLDLLFRNHFVWIVHCRQSVLSVDPYDTKSSGRLAAETGLILRLALATPASRGTVSLTRIEGKQA